MLHVISPLSASLTFWPSYQPVGHGIHLCKPSKPTPISPCPDDLPAAAIPSSVFYLPPSVQDTSPSLVPHGLLPLTHSLLRLQSATLLDTKAHFWTWWRQRKRIGILPETDAHHLHVLKKLTSNPTSQLLTIPRASWEWLLRQFPTDSSPSIFVSRLLTQYDAQQASQPSLRPQTQFSTPPLILGANAASLPRKLLPTMVSYAPPRVPHVPLLPLLIRPCVLPAISGRNPHCLMTRSGSLSSRPIPLNVLPSLNVPPPSHTSLYRAVITSPDSAPGADGIPYSAWRICPRKICKHSF